MMNASQYNLKAATCRQRLLRSPVTIYTSVMMAILTCINLNSDNPPEEVPNEEIQS